MNYEALYLIHEDTYLDHINEKLQLYAMVRQLAHMVKKLPSNRGNSELSHMAALFEKKSTEMFESWNIPESYLFSGDEDDLAYLMHNELTLPETAGFVYCGGDCDDCPCCEAADDCDNEESNKSEDGNELDVGELLTMLGKVMHSIFGDNVTVHVFTE